MKSFQQYLSEILTPKQEYQHRRKHPDLVKDITDKEFINYIHTPKGKDGKPDGEKRIRTSFLKHGDHRWDVMFTVGGSTSSDAFDLQEFPSTVTKRVFDHVEHFVKTHRAKTGYNPMITYDTTHPKKHRIYQAAARRLGIQAQNHSEHYLDTFYDRPLGPKNMEDDQPWIGGAPHRGEH